MKNMNKLEEFKYNYNRYESEDKIFVFEGDDLIMEVYNEDDFKSWVFEEFVENNGVLGEVKNYLDWDKIVNDCRQKYELLTYDEVLEKLEQC